MAAFEDITTTDLLRVAQQQTLMQAAGDATAHTSKISAQTVTRLRKLEGVNDADVHLALQLAIGRHKARAKFGDVAQNWIAAPEAVEQASSFAVAQHKARWIKPRADNRRLIDGCCGIGGDLFAFRQAGIDTLGVDLDPIRVWMANHNCGSEQAAVTTDLNDFVFADDDCLHLDPGRRLGGKRLRRLQDLIPGPETWRALLKQCPDAAIKLAPGTDLTDLEEENLTGHVEYISHRGTMVQAVLWTGCFARGTRTAATRIDTDGHTDTFNAETIAAVIASPKQYLYTVDPAIERADLFGAFAEANEIEAIHPQLGLYTSEARLENPWLNGFELLAETPWRIKTVQRELKARHVGPVEVKTRGKAVDPDAVQKQLQGNGETPLTVFVLRDHKRKFALITRRV